MKMMPLAAAVVATWAFAAPNTTTAADMSADDRRQLTLTLYGNGLALIAEKRTSDISNDFNELILRDISPSLEPESFRLVVGGGFRVSEQTFLPANLSQRELLRAHVGKTIEIARRGRERDVLTVAPAEVVAVEPELVVRIGERFEVNPRGRFSFANIPGGLRARPVMQVRGEGGMAGPLEADIRYLTTGIGWRAEHVAMLDSAMQSLELDTRASISNGSGLDFAGARLHLVAGDVNRTRAPRPLERKTARGLQMMAATNAAPEAAPARDAVAGYHRYRLPGRMNLPDGQTKQVSLIARSAVPVIRQLISIGHPNAFAPPRQARPDHPSIRLTLTNRAEAGEPIPGGRIRLYGEDEDGDALFIGEDRLPDLPAGGEATVTVGRAFDVTVARQRIDVVRQGLGRNTVEMAYRIEIKNGSERREQVTVAEALAGDWRILAESRPHQRKNGQAQWNVSAAPGETVEITYRVRVRR